MEYLLPIYSSWMLCIPVREKYILMTNILHCQSPEKHPAAENSTDTKTTTVAQGSFVIRESLLSGEKALHASMAFQEGEVLSEIGFRSLVIAPNYLSVQFGEAEHGMLFPAHLEYINHSCSPNVFFDVDARHLRALRTIAPGEELCFFYPSTEWSMNQSFQCNCRADNCLGFIEGAAHLEESVLESYELSNHIKAMKQRNRAA
ncbi:SET domain-containing protein [Propionivibrio dicarboxylicus]|uniref:SET domain-containing protein n=1 Tax=Propionivibrio dicarboxylicus TaxID=83767 RepID=A0A1G8J0F2_9RHOO|nr:SET domain-containing methyltransferase [Propionivibrio dicarboxylicus]SDI24709.1 SET domain-containing protein [Propionivibrio dicarboxylicus]